MKIIPDYSCVKTFSGRESICFDVLHDGLKASRELDKLEIGFILYPPTAISVYTLSKHNAWIQHYFQVISSRSTFNTNVSDSHKRYFPWKDGNMNPQNDSHNHAWFTRIHFMTVLLYTPEYLILLRARLRGTLWCHSRSSDKNRIIMHNTH